MNWLAMPFLKCVFADFYYFYRLCSVSFPRGAVGLSVVCDCGISWPYTLDFFVVVFFMLFM